MTLHRRGKPYSLPYARRRLAACEAAIATWRATDCAGDWRRACDKRRELDRLEAEWMRWDRVLRPRPIEEYRLPF
jgi:hypothetical protein